MKKKNQQPRVEEEEEESEANSCCGRRLVVVGCEAPAVCLSCTVAIVGRGIACSLFHRNFRKRE